MNHRSDPPAALEQSAQVVGLSRLHHPVTTLGFGARIGIWFQGCTLQCRGCVSQDTWEVSNIADRVLVDEVLQWMIDRGPVDGLTISGGEPFQQPDALAQIISGFRIISDPARCDVVVYSGYSFSYLRRAFPEIAAAPDALITGRYMESSPGDGLRGSGNQQVHCLTDLGRERYSGRGRDAGRMQIAVTGGSVWMIGIPRREDMSRLEEALRSRGVELGSVSWRC